ncbi:MAG: substrate-binding domain-containing protein [Spirochaetes bacterium]|nr:substrate-binding domain-containing protein [Spirochaetota bacterium]
MKKITIGLLIDSIEHEYQSKIWQGVCSEAELQNVNVISFIGRRIKSNHEFESQANKVYDFASKHRVDGLIILTAAVFSCLPKEEHSDYLSRYLSIPVVSVGVDVEKASSILIDNYKGMYDAVSHLIKEHSINKIAFISGPSENEEAGIRHKAYADVLKDNNIKYNDSLVYFGDFIQSSGAEAVKAMIDERKAEFKAVVAANDYMAFGAMEELERRKIKIPYECAVIGFDNVETSVTVTPPLTTVEQPLIQNGREAARKIISMIKGEPCGQKTILNTSVVLRQSCGCIIADKSEISIPKQEEGVKIVKNELDALISELHQLISTDASSKSFNNFIPRFDSMLRQYSDKGKNLDDLNKVLNSLRRLFFESNCSVKASHSFFRKKEESADFEKSKENYYFGESLIHQCRMMIGTKNEQIQLRRKLYADKEASIINYTGQKILTSFSLNDLFDIIKTEFPCIGITSCHIGLCAGKDSSELVFSMTDSAVIGRKMLYHDNDILPDSVIDKLSSYNLLVEALYFRDEFLGYVIYGVNPLNGGIYETFSSELASSIKAIRLYEDRARVEAEIRKKSDHIQSLVVPMLESIQEITDVSRIEIEKTEKLSSITSDALQKLREANAIIEKASANINKMLDMISIIDDVSSNINVLAINASIESAHAGEYGRGFSIIAEEVKLLSDSTAENAQKISDTLKEVVKAIQDSTIASIDNYNRFSEIDDHVTQVTNQFSGILARMTELSENSNKILDHMNAK